MISAYYFHLAITTERHMGHEYLLLYMIQHPRLRALINDQPRHLDLKALGTPVAPHLEASQASNATASTLYVVQRIRAP